MSGSTRSTERAPTSALRPEELAQLIELARASSKLAYNPYSNFFVGAALLTESGRYYGGCNIENASYGLTCCAERSAIFKAISEGDRSAIRAIAVYTPTPTATAPCGSCRQVIFEFGPNAIVVACCDGKELRQSSIKELLPGAFGPADLLPTTNQKKQVGSVFR